MGVTSGALVQIDTTMVFINCESGPCKVQCLTGRVGEGGHVFCT